MTDSTKWIIRTTDRAHFRSCRQEWDFGSKIRMNFEPVVTNKNLEFGTAIHAGLEAYYDPQTWALPHDVITRNAIAKFIATNKQQRDLAPSLLEEDYDERQELGIGMLKFYCSWAKDVDSFYPVAVEHDFEVPIPVPDAVVVPPDFDCDADGNLMYQGFPVVYQGTIDLVVVDFQGRTWIVDHKTRKSFGDTTWTDIDSQASSYAWALQVMQDIRVEGVIFNELAKTYPVPPKMNKNGKLSVDKRQRTTPDLFRKAIEENYLNPDDYQEFIEFLETRGVDPFVRRIQTPRSRKELAYQGRMIYNEALDMLANPSIYPNPDQFRCGMCAFKDPCRARISGEDYEYILADSSMYKKGN